jgi:hypothetical protein
MKNDSSKGEVDIEKSYYDLLKEFNKYKEESVIEK